MKKFCLFLLFASPLCAQLIVNDPINTAIALSSQSSETAAHLEILRQWAMELENLNQEIRNLEAQLSVQQRIRDVIGDPAAAGASVGLRDLGLSDLLQKYGETFAAMRRLANAIESLRETGGGLYQALDDRTALGANFTRNETPYLRFAAVDRQTNNLASVHVATDARAAALQGEIAAAIDQLRGAGTQAEVDKIVGKVVTLNGQLAHLDAQRHDEADKLHAQEIANENQAAKERQDLLEKQLAEERQTLGIVATWQDGIQLEPTDYTRK